MGGRRDRGDRGGTERRGGGGRGAGGGHEGRLNAGGPRGGGEDEEGYRQRVNERFDRLAERVERLEEEVRQLRGGAVRAGFPRRLRTKGSGTLGTLALLPQLTRVRGRGFLRSSHVTNLFACRVRRKRAL